MNIIVVGAGIAGSVAARVLREAGHTVTVVARDTPSHSVAATAVLRRAWHPDTERADFDHALATYQRWGIPLRNGAFVTNYRTPGRAPRHDPDWQLIDPRLPLLTPDVYGTVDYATARSVRLANGSRLVADAVVCAPGAASPLSAPGSVTWGVTWVHPDPEVLTEPVFRVHHLAPYKTGMAGVVGARVRLGSSSAKTYASALKQAQAMLERFAELGIIRSTRGWEPLAGARLNAAPRVCTRVGVHYLTGYHRTGYALAPADASRLAGILQQARSSLREPVR